MFYIIISSSPLFLWLRRGGSLTSRHASLQIKLLLSIFTVESFIVVTIILYVIIIVVSNNRSNNNNNITTYYWHANDMPCA